MQKLYTTIENKRSLQELALSVCEAAMNGLVDEGDIPSFTARIESTWRISEVMQLLIPNLRTAGMYKFRNLPFSSNWEN